MNRNKVVHFKGSSEYRGDFEPIDEALTSERYNVKREEFGSTNVELSGNKSNNVKDNHYRLEDGRVGMHFVPVSDFGSIESGSERSRDGHHYVDAILRERMGLSEDDQIYGYVNYFHPEQNRGPLRDLLFKTDKIHMGFTHLAAYYGKGYTTHAPSLYKENKFGLTGEPEDKFGYPANVQVVSMMDTDQAVLNRTLFYVDACMSTGVMFPHASPEGYKAAKFRGTDVNTALMFYRDWLNYERYLRVDESWYTYCGGHKTLVATVAMNLPHNLISFQDVYGEEEGKELFDKFKLFYNNIVGPDPGFLPKDETYFEPLWQKEGLKASEIGPFTIEEYDTYQKTLSNDSLAAFTGKVPLPPHRATCWPAQSILDVVFDTVRVYADLDDIGVDGTAAVLMGFRGVIYERFGVDECHRYLSVILPIIKKLVEAEARCNSVSLSEEYIETKYSGLLHVFGGQIIEKPHSPIALDSEKVNDVVGACLATNDVSGIASWLVSNLCENWPELKEKGPYHPDQIMKKVRAEIEHDIAELNKFGERQELMIPPGFTHSLSVGLYKANRFVKVRTICTIVDASELKPKRKITTPKQLLHDYRLFKN